MAHPESPYTFVHKVQNRTAVEWGCQLEQMQTQRTQRERKGAVPEQCPVTSVKAIPHSLVGLSEMMRPGPLPAWLR